VGETVGQQLEDAEGGEQACTRGLAMGIAAVRVPG
jgi:hypothetical protein